MSIDRYGYFPTNVDVDKEYEKISRLDEGKVYELAKKKIDLKPEDL